MTFHPNAAALQLTWHKSSRSNDSGDCVEFAMPGETGSYVRDSKDPNGPVLAFERAAHDAFIRAVADGEFDFGIV